MKNFDLDKIKKSCERAFFCEKETGYQRWITPYKFIVSCGWDPFTYKEYEKKYICDILTGNEKEVFSLIYITIQKILAEIQELSVKINGRTGKPFLNAPAVKYMIECWNPIAFSKSKDDEQRIDKIKKYKQQLEEKNCSPISFNGEVC